MLFVPFATQMGGTSTDVSRFDGNFDHVFETITAGVAIQAPQLDIHTVAAGGGSCLHLRRGMFVVGPDSAGAHPGRYILVCFLVSNFAPEKSQTLALSQSL